MNKEDINKIVALRDAVLDMYVSLDGRSSPATAVVKQAKVAAMCESVIKKIDEMITPYVNFE
ncbi:hypothetical protein CMI47_19055 [Candidatus Pacearchaeota archaeon]|nr:hypothetical protein [Candidatus Pacearchaeota archaeon]|tara:strand:- start:4559 stop:4744 length:186 start_codon:yes stop_codon:yes gene_type:complete